MPVFHSPMSHTALLTLIALAAASLPSLAALSAADQE